MSGKLYPCCDNPDCPICCGTGIAEDAPYTNIKVYVYRNPQECPYPFAEVENGFPVHPGELVARIRQLIAKGKPWATASETVIAILGWMFRKKEIAPKVHIHYIRAGDEERILRFDIRGDLIEPWPEGGMESIQDCRFHFLYDPW